ncbi:YwaF family protein [Lentibacillus sp. Marseille-P4043]|uniref:YwaF family protein n=1 Tax=Lentibacillus sp. Marseille-P4043 TaxID=2040293 RepID=UPI000D0BC6E9|nr:TIGR02206 family membrane protein [Lentibacillus sp. Marseille-P4043]
MRGWFVSIEGDPFIAFGSSHLFMLLIYLIGLLFLLTGYNVLQKNSVLFNMIRWILFSLLVLSELAYQTWTIANGVWSVNEHLPLHLCGIASIIAAIALINYNRRLIITAYFIGFIPALLALITPELPYDFPHFRYWKFFIHHIVISWASIFLVFTGSIKITFKSMLGAYFLLILYAIFIGFVINPVFDANYLYLANTPSASTPLDLLGSGSWYYVNLCLLGFVVFILLLGFSRVLDTIKSFKDSL